MIVKVYIAAPFFNERQLAIVSEVENFLTSKGIDFFSPRCTGTLKDMSKERQQQTKRQIYDTNIRMMDACTHMIACVEEKDQGTTFEIGYYAAKQKPIVLFSEKVGTVNVMLAEAAMSVCDGLYLLDSALIGDYTSPPASLT
jgi:nucleoside 2-deoxyribosyltransferase